jgi:putative integral membrane protein (TIGR02587 family)
MPRASSPPRRPIRKSLEEYGRGIAGGLLFSLPLIYTMEVWWTGFLADPSHLLAYLAMTFALLLGYNRYAGMRRDAQWVEVAIDSIEEMGLGLVISAGVLYLLGRVTSAMSVSEIVGRIVVEAMTVAVGVSVGTAQLAGENRDTGMSGSRRQSAGEPETPHTWGQLVLSFCGAILFASNVAPTEEILMIGVETSPGKLLGLVGFSLAVSGLIFFYSGFLGADRHVRREAPAWMLYSVITSYAAALAAAALLLWFFRGYEGMPLSAAGPQIVVLGLPASLGASAGRLLIQ